MSDDEDSTCYDGPKIDHDRRANQRWTKRRKLTEKQQIRLSYRLHDTAFFDQRHLLYAFLTNAANINVNAVNVNATLGKHGMTPLHVACRHGADKHRVADCAKLLIEYGAHVNAQDHHNRTPLHMACLLHNEEAAETVAQLLIENGASVDMVDKNGMSPLHLTCAKADGTLAKLLITKGSSVSEEDRNGQTPFHWICAVGFPGPDLLEAFVSKDECILEYSDKKGDTPLHLACARAVASEQVVKLLLDQHSANIDAKNRQQETPLHKALAAGNLGVAGLLITRNADWKCKTATGWTCLHMASKSGLDAMELLLAHGAVVEDDAKTNCGRTHLHLAAENNHVDLVFFLLQKYPLFEMQ